jgi:hypothetical protein
MTLFVANVPAQETDTLGNDNQINNTEAVETNTLGVENQIKDSDTVESDVLEVETSNSEKNPSLSENETANENKNVQTTTDRSAPYNGFGLNFGVTIFAPKEVNVMLEDMYDDLKSGYSVYDMGTPRMFMGESFKLKGVFYLNHNLALEPYGQAFWAGKWLFISGATDKSAWVNLMFYSAGLNFWVRVNPKKLVSFKTGVGGFAGYSHIEISGDLGKVSLKGSGFGANLLAGIDVTFSKAVINLDFTAPIGVIKYNQRKGHLQLDSYSPNYVYSTSDYTNSTRDYNYYYSKYPKKVLLAGFEFRPGVTFRF